MTAIIVAITNKSVLISADRRKSNYDGYGKFVEPIDEWAIKTIQLSSHIALSALGEVETTTNVKKRLKQEFENNPNPMLEELVCLSQSIFREELMETKIKHAGILNKRKSFFSFTKKIKPEDIKQNAAYFLGGFDLFTNKPFLYAFINGDNYKVHKYIPDEVYPLGDCQDQMANYLNNNLTLPLNINSLKVHFEKAIAVAASNTQSVNTNVLHCLVDKSGVTFIESPIK
ncbi:TPA: Fur family transcriptional regulator [Bacillus toyonensis]|uniref:Fur family transcriptional regulator n=1 Tax=Bacillus toyonensis TaxID=155322 RepID=UPI000BFBC6AC|nr:Fur family transcriptional regulator [Bacillus toyonensis]PHA83192.1 Fur family transcriptional regulator [Bacillus toyonensis]QWH48505.1 Fur family transcriptional regulator [Bacillus toyonensis]QWI08756.1 Fur family transcriptional regulator [Bacillus toyonensis]HDR7319927.1 Fur family transcriptional regulator [Bacillus toyonensis]HDR7385646.1 Fur family transcriptional regulator [Bacillus toyonensis]